MRKTFVLSQAAEADIEQQRQWYEERLAFDASDRFVASTFRCFQRIAEMPGIGRIENPKLDSLAGIRSASIDGFEDLRIYYLEQDQEIRILRILHTARDTERLLEQFGYE